MKKKSLWTAVCVAAALTLMSAGTVLAEEENQDAPRNEWINMDKGPGVAQWVDENGEIHEQPGIKPEETAALPEGPGTVPRQEDQSAQPQDPGQQEGQAEQTDGEVLETEPETEGVLEGENQEGAGEQPVSGRTIDPGRPMVALTFDDGPFAPVGNQIMDCMAQYGGKATFYVVGNRCGTYAAEMQRMAAEGHEIGNHTYEHKYLNKLNAEQIRYQINKGSEAIQAASGVAPATVRLPGGNKNATVLANVSAPIIMWSIDTLDWKTKNTQSTVDKVLGTVKDGDIVLMHELYAQTGAAAVQIIPALVERGYQLVTVSEMAQYRGGLQGGRMYSAFRP